MFRAWHDRARPVTSVVAALLLMFISLGVGGIAVADPGNGNGKAAATTHASSKAHHSTTTSHKAATTSSTSTHTSAKSSGSSKSSSHSTSGTSGTSGDPTQPQPISKADGNSGGANGQCPGGAYCSTRDGSPSLNGNGGGKATGKPCAGCVGKADNKNPKGQRPDGSDHNNGYECDGNNGIGKTNPAHTGCQPSTPGDTCQPGDAYYPTCTPPACTPDMPNYPTCVPPAGCTPDMPNYPTCVPGTPTPPKGTELRRPPTVLGTEAVRAPTAVRPSQGTLPNTGASSVLSLLAATGAGLLLVGGLTVAMRRRGTSS
jgi:LPXTG-motif cell wall-anchored protein